MREITGDTLAQAGEAHVQAVRAYIAAKNDAYQQELFQAVTAVIPVGFDFRTFKVTQDWSWLEDFLLADVPSLRKMTQEKGSLLKFEQFKKIYQDRFCNGSAKYVDNAGRYNAYTLIRNLGVQVCPYCDEEYLDLLEQDGAPSRRTLELDHFFPKGAYPALAMCFYNLVPSGQVCNGLKLEQELGMSPFEKGIEEHTWLSPDLPIGANIENVPVEECTINFHAKGGMPRNISALRLEQRYQRHKDKAHRYLLLKQNYGAEKIEEMVRMGFFASAEQAYEILYEETADGGKQLLQKLKYDILGR